MGFYNGTRSPEEVQANNGDRLDFNGIKTKWENTTPLRGKRYHLDIRPIGDRSRSHERIVKVSDSEFYLTNTAYAYSELRREEREEHPEHNRCITFKQDEYWETITVHVPRSYWGDGRKKPFLERDMYPRGISAPSTYHFYEHNLPMELSLHKVGTKPYVKACSEQSSVGSFLLWKGDISFIRKIGDKWFSPFKVYAESKLSLDRDKTKAIRKSLTNFIGYVQTMLPIMEGVKGYTGYYSYSPFSFEKTADRQGMGEKILPLCNKSWEELVVLKDEDDVPDTWFTMVEMYRQRLVKKSYSRNRDTNESVVTEQFPSKQRIKTTICEDVYKQALPFLTERVPLGVPFMNNKYQSW